MDYFLSLILRLSDPLFYLGYVPLVTSAAMLFLAFYLAALIGTVKKVSSVQPVSLPLWLNIMYPGWLDKLSLVKIIRAFALGIGISIVLWTILAVVFLAVLAVVYRS